MAQFKDRVALLLPICNQSPVSPRKDSEPHHVHLCLVSGSSPSFSLSCSIPDRTPPTSSATVPTPIIPIPHTSSCFPGVHCGVGVDPAHTSLQPSPWGDIQRCLVPPDCPGWLRHHQFGRKEWTHAATSHLQRCSFTFWLALTASMISSCVTGT